MLPFNNSFQFYQGKVRDVYTFSDNKIAMVASNRISAFDVVLPKPIPYKGQVLNQIAALFLKNTQHIVPNWYISSPLPHVAIGIACTPFPIEMVVRNYLTGHAWRVYASGLREICGVALPEGLKENDKLPSPIITPTTKAHEGHDQDISANEIITSGLLTEKHYKTLAQYSLELFDFGTKYAEKQGLILVDTKYEFGIDHNGIIRLIDEIHTPDSSRYFYLNAYPLLQKRGEPQKQLSKEFVRKWLIENNFQGREGDIMPEMSQQWIDEIKMRYIELFEKVTGTPFEPTEIPSDIQTVQIIESQLKEMF